MGNGERELRLEGMSKHPDRMKAANNDPLFALWVQEVDSLLLERVGLPHGSMNDWGWHDAYSDDFTPEDAVSEFCSSEMDMLLSAIQEL